MMRNGDPRDRFFYPTLTLMIDSYIIDTTVAEIFWKQIYVDWENGADHAWPPIFVCGWQILPNTAMYLAYKPYF